MLIHALSPLHWKQESLPSDDVSTVSSFKQTVLQTVPLPPKGGNRRCVATGAWRCAHHLHPCPCNEARTRRMFGWGETLHCGMGLIAWGQRKRLSGWV